MSYYSFPIPTGNLVTLKGTSSFAKTTLFLEYVNLAIKLKTEFDKGDF